MKIVYFSSIGTLRPNWHDPCSIPGYSINDPDSQPEKDDMKWETPAYNDIRFGFEVTMYINNK
ncbi:MAG: pyrroloquinoline quinone precursor peptide PqqA [Gammaproteobacteria bacterium]